MRTRPALKRRIYRLGALAMAVEAVLLVCVAPGVADPGAPGLDRPSTAVYRTTAQQPVLGGGQPQTPGGSQPQVLGELEARAPSSGEDQVPNADGRAENRESAGVIPVAVSDGSADDAGDVQSLPFTGLSAALVIAVGLAALLLGLAAHAAAGRLRRA